ncbi:MAG: DUF47 family protein [Candidatus Heimdallarchaeota archaeon]|nr:DUF47 family protein [Candidatus Heimdallarchaeota archaeon]MDH5645947.1 DUF47 family protein [Candidatus Heimdallarchaeota archaeon]
MNREEQKQKFIEISNLVREVGILYGNSLKDPSKTFENLPAILEKEDLADSIQDELDDHFRTQRNIPYLALDRAKLVRRLDDTLDELALAGRTLNAFSSNIPDNFGEKATSLADLVISITSLLAEAVETIYTSFSDALVICEKIENSKDKVVEVSFELEKDMMNNENSDWKQFISASRIISRTVSSVSVLKAASEVLVLMSYKYE